MTLRPLLSVLALVAATAGAQTVSVDPMDSVQPRSRASTLKPQKKIVSMNDASLSIAAANVSQPEHRVVPQLTVPFGPGEQARAQATPYIRRAPSAADTAAAALVSYDDAAASCEARAGEGMRAVCRDRVARAREAGASLTQ